MNYILLLFLAHNENGPKQDQFPWKFAVSTVCGGCERYAIDLPCAAKHTPVSPPTKWKIGARWHSIALSWETETNVMRRKIFWKVNSRTRGAKKGFWSGVRTAVCNWNIECTCQYCRYIDGATACLLRLAPFLCEIQNKTQTLTNNLWTLTRLPPPWGPPTFPFWFFFPLFTIRSAGFEIRDDVYCYCCDFLFENFEVKENWKKGSTTNNFFGAFCCKKRFILYSLFRPTKRHSWHGGATECAWLPKF